MEHMLIFITFLILVIARAHSLRRLEKSLSQHRNGHPEP